jgi:hypothetical protein
VAGEYEVRGEAVLLLPPNNDATPLMPPSSLGGAPGPARRGENPDAGPIGGIPSFDTDSGGGEGGRRDFITGLLATDGCGSKRDGDRNPGCGNVDGLGGSGRARGGETPDEL